MGCVSSTRGESTSSGDTGPVKPKNPRLSVTVEAEMREGHLAHNLTRHEFERDIRTVYDIDDGKELGEGAFAYVRRCTHKTSGNTYAVKVMKLESQLSTADLAELKQEIDIMKMLDHPNIVRLQQVFIKDNGIYLVMDLASGGDISTRFAKDRSTFRDEALTASIIRQITSAIRYCHDRGVVHRDLKMENLMLADSSITSDVKLVDFGLSILQGKGDNGAAGTADYMSPEQVKGSASYPCDCWAIGVITYALLAGHFPFYAATDEGVKLKVRFSNYGMAAQDFEHVSEDGKDFLKKMLVKNPAQRMTAVQALEHPWLQGAAKQAAEPVSAEVIRSLSKSASKRTLGMGKLGMAIIAHSMESAQLHDLLEEFKKMDKDNSGLIDMSEFKAALLLRGVQEGEAERIFKSIDVVGNGQLTYNEFLASAININTVSDNNFRAAFDMLDYHKSGVLDTASIKLLVGADMSEEKIRDTIAEIDEDGDGCVSYAEFRSAMRKSMSVAVLGVPEQEDLVRPLGENGAAPLLEKRFGSKMNLNNSSMLNLAQMSIIMQSKVEENAEEYDEIRNAANPAEGVENVPHNVPQKVLRPEELTEATNFSPAFAPLDSRTLSSPMMF